MIFKRFACIVTIIMALVGCGKTVHQPYDNSKKLAELDEKLKIAKENTKKAAEDLEKTKERLKTTQEQASKAQGEEKVKLEKKALELQEALAQHDKTIKDKNIKIIVELLNLIDQSDAPKRKSAYESLPTHQYIGDILKTYFAGGDKPKEQVLKPLEQTELNKIQKDLVAVVSAIWRP